jgi:CBS domain-containing protein
MLVKEVMREPVCIGPEESLKTAALRLKEENAGCLLVSEEGRLIGLLTDRDLLLRGVASMRDPGLTRVREAMSVEIQHCSEDDPLERAADLMRSNHVHRLPVVDSEQRLVGVVSLNDVDHGASQRAPFEIVFYKEITDSYGHPHHVEQRRVVVGPGRSRDEAVAAALRNFEHEHGCAWNTFADGYDVVEVQPEAQGRAPGETSHPAER